MGVVMVACWIVVLLSFCPASAVARLSPAGRVRIDPSVETILYLERTPTPFSSGTQPRQRKPDEHLASIKNEERRKVSGDAENSIFGHFERTMLPHGSTLGRRGLVGSSPPTCRGRCGACTPCKPVHVAIGSPHGVISETEYYPEVWRCLCGNRYYMP